MPPPPSRLLCLAVSVLERSPNFRAVAGVRPGLLFRSGALHDLTDADRETLASLGVTVAYDLRGDREREVEPTAAPALRQVHVPLVRDRLDLGGYEDGEGFLGALYLHLLANSADAIGAVLGPLAEADHPPAVVHCSAGKDRTGVTCAVLQLTVGVDREAVLDDYERTSQFQSAERAERVIARLAKDGIPAAVAAGLMGAPRQAMADALDSLPPVIDEWLTGPAGLTPAQVDGLRARFTP